MKSLRWNSVVGGIVAVVCLVTVTLLVLIYARSSALHGSSFRLFIAAPDATGLLKGSDVWLNGQRVGVVRNITFNSPTTPPEVRIVIETRVLSDVRSLIRLDSRANLRSGGTVIGAPVVYITSGTMSAREVVPDDTLRAAGRADLELAASKFAESMQEVPTLLSDSRVVMENAKIAAGRMTTAFAATGGPRNVAFTKNASALMARLSGGRGSATRIMNDTILRIRLSRSMAAMDTLRSLLASRTTELGRFRRDSTLAPTVRALAGDVAHLRDLASSTGGTIGRARADSSLRLGIDSAFSELNALLADIKKHPLKYSRVF